MQTWIIDPQGTTQFPYFSEAPERIWPNHPERRSPQHELSEIRCFVRTWMQHDTHNRYWVVSLGREKDGRPAMLLEATFPSRGAAHAHYIERYSPVPNHSTGDLDGHRVIERGQCGEVVETGAPIGIYTR